MASGPSIASSAATPAVPLSCATGRGGGRWLLQVWWGGLAEVTLAERATAEVDIVVPGFAIVRGRDLAFGLPVAGIDIHTGVWQGGVTGEEGSYEFLLAGPPAADWICVHPKEVADTQVGVAASRWGEVITPDIDLGSLRLSGTVVDALTGRPIEVATVSVDVVPATITPWAWGTVADTDNERNWSIAPLRSNR
jgi:hypothetical protein